VATILIIFPKISWPNWQILCSLYVCLCFVWRIGGPSPPAPRLWLRHWTGLCCNSSLCHIKRWT